MIECLGFKKDDCPVNSVCQRAACLILLLLGISGCCHRQSTAIGGRTLVTIENQGLSISVHFASADYDIGDKIIATVTFTNTTAQGVLLPTDVPRFDTEIIITNENGQQLELKKPANWHQLTDFQKKLRTLIRNPKFKTVAPGAQETYRVKMTELFDLNAAGKYDVEIHYSLSSDGRCIIDARSNKATFSIGTH